MKINRALLVVDMQNDFCPGGALGIPQADRIIPAVNRYMRSFARKKLVVFVSRDWHPVRTSHFKDFGGIWPAHCIQNTSGSDFCPGIKIPKGAVFLYKGMDPHKDSYSVFHAEDDAGTGFLKILNIYGIKELYIAGLATDYCVKFTTLDALKNGFKVRILEDAVKGVDLKPGDSQKALKQMLKQGAKTITSKQLEGLK